MEKYLGVRILSHCLNLGPSPRTWGTSATDLLEAVGRKTAEPSGESRSVKFSKQLISVDIQRGNCHCVLGTVEESRGLDDFFYILDSKKRKSSVFWFAYCFLHIAPFLWNILFV